MFEIEKPIRKLSLNGQQLSITRSQSNFAGILNGTAEVITADDLEGVEKIPRSFFDQNRVLKKITLPASCKKIEQSAFANTDFTSINLENVEEIEEHAFSYAYGLNEIDLSGCKKLGQYSFYGSPIKKAKFSSTTKELPDFLFGNIDVRDLVIEGGENIERIGHSLFEHAYGNSITRLLTSLPNLKKMGQCNFSNGDITSLTLPERLEEIGPQCFMNMWNLASISFPASLKSIGAGSFQNTKFYNDIPSDGNGRKIYRDGDLAIFFEGEIPVNEEQKLDFSEYTIFASEITGGTYSGIITGDKIRMLPMIRSYTLIENTEEELEIPNVPDRFLSEWCTINVKKIKFTGERIPEYCLVNSSINADEIEIAEGVKRIEKFAVSQLNGIDLRVKRYIKLPESLEHISSDSFSMSNVIMAFPSSAPTVDASWYAPYPVLIKEEDIPAYRTVFTGCNFNMGLHIIPTGNDYAALSAGSFQNGLGSTIYFYDDERHESGFGNIARSVSINGMGASITTFENNKLEFNFFYESTTGSITLLDFDSLEYNGETYHWVNYR